MTNVSMRVIALSFLITGGATSLWYYHKNTDNTSQATQAAAPAVLTPPAAPDASSSPFTLAGDDDAMTVSTVGSQSASPSESVAGEVNDALLPEVDVASLGRNGLSDEDFLALVARLKDDPDLLQQLIDEARQETDPTRLALLARLLGEAGGESVLLLASEWIFSGEPGSRERGLNLLQIIQPGNEQARDIAVDMLGTEIDPDILIGTLSSLGVPGDVDEQTRAYLADQIAWLTEHEDTTVRGISLDILSRWSTDSRYTSVFLAGLDDESARVRRSAAYALADHEDKSPEVIDGLLRTIQNSSESKGVRQAAILAARRMPITDAQRLSIQTVEQQLNTVVR